MASSTIPMKVGVEAMVCALMFMSPRLQEVDLFVNSGRRHSPPVGT